MFWNEQMLRYTAKWGKILYVVEVDNFQRWAPQSFYVLWIDNFLFNFISFHNSEVGLLFNFFITLPSINWEGPDSDGTLHHQELRTPREEIAFTARPKIQSQSQIFRYSWSIFCLPHRPISSDFCHHWVPVFFGRNDYARSRKLKGYFFPEKEQLLFTP